MSTLRMPVVVTAAIVLGAVLFVLAGGFGTASLPAEAAPAAAASNITLLATQDSWVDENQPTTNFGGDTRLHVGRVADASGALGNRQTLVQFDLSSLPQGASIQSARLELYQIESQGPEQYRTRPDANFDPWDEMKVNWNNKPSAFDVGDPWVTLNSTNGWKAWDVTNIVSNWNIGEIDNYGITLHGDGDTEALRVFASREYGKHLEPRLTIEYVVQSATPTPTATRTPEPTWTPVPTATPDPATPTPTPTPPVYAFPYEPQIATPIFTLPDPDLSIHGIEITQGVQCFDTSNGLAGCSDNSLPVVNKKDTTARIYLDYDGLFSSQSNVPVRLYIRANNVWYTANTQGTARPTIRQDLSDSADVYFNVNFTNDVQVDFYAIVDPNDVIDESNESNNRYPSSGYITLTFQKRDDLKVVGQRLRYHPSGYSGSQYAGGWAVNGGAADWFEQMLPVRNNGINYSVKSGYLDWTTSLSSGDGQHDLIRYLNIRWIMENAFSWLFGTGAFTGADHVYGWAPNDGYTGGHADMPVYPHAGGLGVVGIGTDNPGTSTDNPGSGALIFGHEIVHDYDIFHTNTGGDDCGSNDSNSDFPYSTSSIQEFGFNPITGKIYDPDDTHDLMSYCPAGGSKEGWVSPFTWNRMFSNFATTRFLAVPTDEQQPGKFRVTQDEESLVVNATVYNPKHEDYDSNNPGELSDLHRIGAGVAFDYPFPDGEYAVQLRNGTTAEYTATFNVSFESEYDHHGGETHDDPPFPAEDTSKMDVSFIVPWVDGTTSVVLLHQGEVIDEQLASGNTPEVTITAPAGAQNWTAGNTQTIEWTGSDADGDTLSYTILYSNDGGATWSVLETGWPNTQLDVPVDSLAGGSDVRFRVVATDGLNIGYDETDEAISVPNKAPDVVVLHPADGAVFAPGGLVVLQGKATDMEDGNLADGVLHWSSDVQGSLGIGPSLPLNHLDPGEHVITLTATDSLGIPSSQSVTILIGHRAHLPIIQK